MCVVSMIHDHYEPQIPWIEPEPYAPYIPTTTGGKVTVGIPIPLDFNKLRELIEEFKALVEAAKFIDTKTGQPDCLDPEKAKLEERVKELEAIIAKPPEFLIVKGGGLEPGRYRVLEGKLYREVE